MYETPHYPQVLLSDEVLFETPSEPGDYRLRVKIDSANQIDESDEDNNILLLKTNMGAGHMGSSGRYQFYDELAFEYAFMLDTESKLIQEAVSSSLDNNFTTEDISDSNPRKTSEVGEWIVNFILKKNI